MMLNGCGGGSSTINEDPTSGSGNSNANGSCAASSNDCLEFSLDYPVAGLNFTCSSAANQSFVTKASETVLLVHVKLVIPQTSFTRYSN